MSQYLFPNLGCTKIIRGLKYNIWRIINCINHHLPSLQLSVRLHTHTHNSAHVHILHESRLYNSISAKIHNCKSEIEKLHNISFFIWRPHSLFYLLPMYAFHFRVFSNKQRRNSAAIGVVFPISSFYLLFLWWQTNPVSWHSRLSKQKWVLWPLLSSYQCLGESTCGSVISLW